MKKNITLSFDESLLRKCKHLAVEEGKSVSKWVEHKLAEIIIGKEKLRKSKENALRLMQVGIDLGGKPLSRDEIYDR